MGEPEVNGERVDAINGMLRQISALLRENSELRKAVENLQHATRNLEQENAVLRQRQTPYYCGVQVGLDGRNVVASIPARMIEDLLDWE